MNSEGLKKNLGLLVFLTVLVLGLAFCCWRLQAALAEQKSVVEELDSEQVRLTELQRTKPFPSSENLAAVHQNRILMQELYGRLHGGAYRPVVLPKVDRVQWQALLGEKLADLNREAKRAGIALPGTERQNRYAFSFDKYLVTFPAAAAVPRLTKQLITIDKLARMLYKSAGASSNGVYSLDAIAGQGGGETADEAGDSLEQLPNGTIFRRTPLELKFTCSTKALQHFINSLATSDWLFVVRALDVQVKTVSYSLPGNQGAGPAPSGSHRSAGPSAPPPGMFLPSMPGKPGNPGASVAPMSPVTPTTPATPQKLERDELSVTIKIDLIEFPAPGEARTAPAKGAHKAESAAPAPSQPTARPEPAKPTPAKRGAARPEAEE